MGTILGKGFPKAQVHTEFIAQVLKALVLWTVCMSCLSKTLSQNYCPHGKIAFCGSSCIYNVIMNYTVLLCKAKKK